MVFHPLQDAQTEEGLRQQIDELKAKLNAAETSCEDKERENKKLLHDIDQLECKSVVQRVKTDA